MGTMTTTTIVDDVKLRAHLGRISDLRHTVQRSGSEFAIYWYAGPPQAGNANLVAKLSIHIDENGLPHTLQALGERVGFMLGI